MFLNRYYLGDNINQDEVGEARSIRHVSRVGEKRKGYRVFVGKLEGWRPLGRLSHRREDNNKI